MWFAALLKLIPGRDFFYGALIIGAALFAWHCYDKYTDAVDFARTVKAESAALDKQAKQDIKDKDAAYIGAMKTIGDAYATALKNASVAHDSDAQRLREYAAYRATHPSMDASGGKEAPADGRPGSLSQLGAAALGLADALRTDDAALVACYADRDEIQQLMVNWHANP